MIYYKEIPCQDMDSINREIMAWYHRQPDLAISDVFWNSIDHRDFLLHCPGFSTWCDAAAIKIRHIALTIGRHADCCPPHIDTPMSKVFSRWKLSWPVANYHDTFNCWYEHTVPNPVRRSVISGGKRYDSRDQLREICRREVVTPCLIDPSIPHDVIFGSDATYPRLVLQCMLLIDPEEQS